MADNNEPAFLIKPRWKDWLDRGGFLMALAGLILFFLSLIYGTIYILLYVLRPESIFGRVFTISVLLIIFGIVFMRFGKHEN